ncbi:putative L-type lectin-domain containing receptor kinase S.7 [Apium graveolens]|uniref:putative L-type lectin-domain containing receptor kinase S.7 n=1 Tax=Apium graveolens TaxID=4045 RepID=UPI003D7A6583
MILFSSTTPLVFFIILLLFFNTTSSQENVSFNFPSFTSLRNLTLLGDSFLRDGVIGLTKQLGVPSSSSGTIIYNYPIQFSASFSTCFSFSINNLNPGSFGDGLAFFISPDNQTLGSPGGYLGLFNSTLLTNNNFVAIEFDTRQDLHFDDPNDNHVGLDIHGLTSIKTADVINIGIDLKSGNLITAWIDYKDDKKILQVFLSYSSSKPVEPVLVVDIDLSEYLRQFKYVGFSASTEGSTETHLLQTWSFSTFGLKSVSPRFPPHNVSDSSVIISPPMIPASGKDTKHHNRIGWGLGIAGPAFFCVFLGLFAYISVKKWKGMRMDKSIKAELVTGPRQFSYKELKIATKGFHASRIIGHGAFGTVYKAFFMSLGTMSAVKRSKHSHEGKSEFLAELSIIACLRHKNLVQLQGWCAEKGELLLVYEFMPNGSLDNLLYPDSEQGFILKWLHRYNIAVGLASVLTYLHQECEQQVIHRDIKTSNIMLDANFNARLGDFGLARLMDHDKSPVSTLTAGTMGYLAPEYLQYGKATEKTDVFSYGVVILELACGRRPIDKEIEGQKMVNLVDWVWGLHSQGRLVEAVDRRLNGEFNVEEAKMLLLVGLSCANPDSSERPTMRRVFQILNGEAEPMLVPKMKPTLSFSNHLLLSLEDIVSDCEESQTPERILEINVV